MPYVMCFHRQALKFYDEDITMEQARADVENKTKTKAEVDRVWNGLLDKIKNAMHKVRKSCTLEQLGEMTAIDAKRRIGSHLDQKAKLVAGE